MASPFVVEGPVVKGERSESEGHGAQRSAFDDRAGDHTIHLSGEAEKANHVGRIGAGHADFV
jgi:hypothetical protein